MSLTQWTVPAKLIIAIARTVAPTLHLQIFKNGVPMAVLTARVFANNTVKTERTPKLGNAGVTII